MSTEIIKLDERRGHTSASNATADSLCAGRHQAQIGLPDIPSSDSEFGTQIHEALASDDPSKLDGDQMSIYDSCVEIREKAIKDTFGAEAEKAVDFKHRRFWWKSSDGKLEHSGEVDLLVVAGAKGLLIDYKALPGDVEESATNQQLRDQVALSAGHLKLIEIDVLIIQPLVTHSPSVCRYNLDSIKRSQVEMAQRVRASNDPNAKRTAGTVQCKFCKARFTCKQYSEFTALAAPPSMSTFTIPVPMWTPEQRALFCERLPVAVKWLEECKNQLKDMISKNPESVPGWKLADGCIRRPFNNPNELHSRFIASGGTTEQFMACVDIGKGKLEAQLRAITKLKGKALAAKVEEMTAGITDERKDAPSLERIK